MQDSGIKINILYSTRSDKSLIVSLIVTTPAGDDLRQDAYYKENHMTRIRELAQRITDKYSTEREKAVALHDYVRVNIKFGFNRYFDLSTPDHTLDLSICPR